MALIDEEGWPFWNGLTKMILIRFIALMLFVLFFVWLGLGCSTPPPPVPIVQRTEPDRYTSLAIPLFFKGETIKAQTSIARYIDAVQKVIEFEDKTITRDRVVVYPQGMLFYSTRDGEIVGDGSMPYHRFKGSNEIRVTWSRWNGATGYVTVKLLQAGWSQHSDRFEHVVLLANKKAEKAVWPERFE